MVDVGRLELPTPCLQNKGPTLCNPLSFNTYAETKTLSAAKRMCVDVCGCSHLLVRSLQKSLQSRGGLP